jgi:hypothetical protein
MILTLGLIASGIIYVNVPAEKQTELLIENFKTLLGLTLITIVGGAVKWLYIQATEENPHLSEKPVLRINLRDDFKKACSKLTEGLTDKPNDPLPYNRYINHINELGKVKQSLKDILDDLDVKKESFKDYKSIKGDIEKMIDAMAPVLDEYTDLVENGKIDSYNYKAKDEEMLELAPIHAQYLSELKKKLDVLELKILRSMQDVILRS